MGENDVLDKSPVLKSVRASITGLWYLGILAVGLFPVIAGIALISPPAATYELPLYAAVDAGTADKAGVPFSGTGQPNVRIVRFENPVFAGSMAGLTVAVRSLMLAALAVGIAVFILIIGALRKLLASIGKGQTFDPANATRLRSVGVTVMVAGPVFGFLHFLIARDLIGSSEALRTSVQPRLDLHLITVLLGLLVVIIGRAFEVGSRLQSDRDLTI